MLDLLKSLDQTLPEGSEVTLFNIRVNDAIIGGIPPMLGHVVGSLHFDVF